MVTTLKFLRMHQDAILPTRGSINAAGLDLYSVERVIIDPHKYVSVRTGLSVATPYGYYGRIAPRSGLAITHAIDVLAGVIDCDYRGEIMCILINHGDEPVTIDIGARVAQLIIESIITPQPEWSDSLDETERSKHGFGSTGT